MRALVRREAGIELDSRYSPPSVAALAPGEVIVRPQKVGIGQRDLAVAKREHAFRGILGHEFVGVVDEVGQDATPEVRQLRGQRVVGDHVVSCGDCDMCRGGLALHCRSQQRLGEFGRDGCLSTVFAMPAVNLRPVPDEVDDDHAVFVQALGAAVHMAQQLTIAGKPYVTILGDGVLALLTAQVMTKMNASVRVIGEQASNLALCEKWNVKHRPANEIGRRADQDVVVDCGGHGDAGAGIELALQLVRPRGRVITRQPQRAANLPGLVEHEVMVIGSTGSRIDEALRMVQRLEVDVISLIDRRMKLEDGFKILEHAARPGALKVIVEM